LPEVEIMDLLRTTRPIPGSLGASAVKRAATVGARGSAPAATFRRLASNEHERLLRHLLLDAEDRRLRFGGYIGEERLRTYCARLGRHPSRAH
jgi:hypothetical protein